MAIIVNKDSARVGCLLGVRQGVVALVIWGERVRVRAWVRRR